MQFFLHLSIALFSINLFSHNLASKETWLLDKSLSTVSFQLPILFAEDVKGEFKEIEGIIEIDLKNKINNKAIFSVKPKSIEMNYEKYKNILLSNIFFDVKKFPVAVIDTKKFSYANENKINLNVELIIKDISLNVPLQLEIIQLAKEFIQINAKLTFSRNYFNLGTGKWSSTYILKDKVSIKTKLFLYKNQ